MTLEKQVHALECRVKALERLTLPMTHMGPSKHTVEGPNPKVVERLLGAWERSREALDAIENAPADQTASRKCESSTIDDSRGSGSLPEGRTNSPTESGVSMSDEEILALPFADRTCCERVARNFIVNEKFTPFGILSSCETKDEAGAIARLGSGVIRRARLDGFKAALAMSVPERDKVKAHEWPANIVADRHEVSGKWVLSYLTDEQAKICKLALPALAEEQCGICGDYHDGIVPRSCETGDGE